MFNMIVMREHPQLYCGECGATSSTKFCTKQKGQPGRVEWRGRDQTLVDEPIEFCRLRLIAISKRQGGGNNGQNEKV